MATNMVDVKTKVPKDLYEELQREATARGMSLYEFFRLKLSQSDTGNSADSATTAIQFRRLESQLTVLQKGVDQSVISRAHDPRIEAMTQMIESLSQGREEAMARAEMAENEVKRMHERVNVLIEHFVLHREETTQQRREMLLLKNEPFGLPASLVKDALQATHTMARANISRQPEAYKEFLQITIQESKLT